MTICFVAIFFKSSKLSSQNGGISSFPMLPAVAVFLRLEAHVQKLMKNVLNVMIPMSASYIVGACAAWPRACSKAMMLCRISGGQHSRLPSEQDAVLVIELLKDFLRGQTAHQPMLAIQHFADGGRQISRQQAFWYRPHRHRAADLPNIAGKAAQDINLRGHKN